MFNPFSTTLKYKLNDNQTITLSPTLRGTIKAFAPVYLLMGALYALFWFADKFDKSESAPEDDPQKN